VNFFQPKRWKSVSFFMLLLVDFLHMYKHTEAYFALTLNKWKYVAKMTSNVSWWAGLWLLWTFSGS